MRHSRTGVPHFLIGLGSPADRILFMKAGDVMRELETNDWMFLNRMIYKIYTVEDLDQMRRQFLEQLQMLVDFDSADFYLAAPGGEYKLGALIQFHGEVKRHDSLQVILEKDHELTGVVTLYRSIGKANFEYSDMFVLDVLKDHLAYRLWQHQKNADVSDHKITVSEAVRRYELTRREHTVLKRLLAGEDNAQICEQLMISENTLKKHILNLYRKLGIKNRVQLFKMIREKEKNT